MATNVSSKEVAEIPQERAAVQQQLWNRLKPVATPISVRKGVLLFREGDPVNGLYIVRKGRVRLSIAVGRRSITYRTVGPRYILGLPAIVRQGPYSLTAETLEACEFDFVDTQTAFAYLREHVDVCMEVLKFMGQEVVWIRQLQAAHLRPSA